MKMVNLKALLKKKKSVSKNSVPKIIAINLLITLLVVVFFETAFFFAGHFLGHTNLGWVKSPNIDLIHKGQKDPCEKMISHPFYSHIHNHQKKCEVLGGIVDGPFVFYNENFNSKKSILILGGSTSDGTRVRYANGKTWPYLFSKILNDNNHNLNVINGSVHRYSSSQELLKLIIDGLQIDTQLKAVISLNGINDIAQYQDLEVNNLTTKKFPYWSPKLMKGFSEKKYIIQDQRDIPRVFPNIARFIRYVTPKFKNNKNQDWYQSINFRKKLSINNTDLWFRNIRLMHAITSELDIKYYVFLQPTMGLTGIQTPSDENTKDFKIFNNYKKNYSTSKKYLHELNDTYSKMRIFCSKLTYCYDISSIAYPGNNYFNIRHHNENGNLLISKEIYSIIKPSLK